MLQQEDLDEDAVTFVPTLGKYNSIPADTWRNNDVIITSKRRRNVVLTQ